jgi:NTP pyrophosphatase (non-canonical NTP hydrolase)
MSKTEVHTYQHRPNRTFDETTALTFAEFIDDLAEVAGQIARSLGWEEGPERTFGEEIALMYSELSEALEAFREHQPYFWRDPERDYKPEGQLSELADVIIRILHYCDRSDLPLGLVMMEKMGFNANRRHRHGGKAL